MNFIKKIADNRNTNSFASKFRHKRHNLFMKLVSNYKSSGNILDVGGTMEYWMKHKDDVKGFQMTIVNLSKQQSTLPNVTSEIADATNLINYHDGQFDIVFSNSVIEHLYTKENQKKMANEVRRVGQSYFVQTPNKYFPFEPHFLFPLYQFLPNFLKLFLLKNFSLGHIGRIEDPIKAQDQIDEIRLLSKPELKLMFPDAEIFEEKFLFLTKSFVAYSFNSNNDL